MIEGIISNMFESIATGAEDLTNDEHCFNFPQCTGTDAFCDHACKVKYGDDNGGYCKPDKITCCCR